MSNKEIECLLRQKKIYKWQIAKQIGIHETSFVRWFREPLSQVQIQQILHAIDEIQSNTLTKQKEC